LPAYLLGRGRRGLLALEQRGGGTRGHPTRIKRLGRTLGVVTDVHLWLSNGLHFGEDPKVGTTYAPEGMGPRSGVHDGKSARRGTLIKPLLRQRSAPAGGGETGRMSGLLVAVLDNQPTDD